jgi:heavy metal sensor kinase
MGRSIRVRLLVWYAAVLTAVVGGFAAILYFEVRASRLRELDAPLEATAAGLDANLRLFPRHLLTGEPPPESPSGEPAGPRPDRPPPKGDPFGKEKKGPPKGMKEKKGPPPDDWGPKGPKGPPPEERHPKGPKGPRPEPPERLLATLSPPGPPEAATANGIYFAVWRADGSTLKASDLPDGTAFREHHGDRPAVSFNGPYRERVVHGPSATVILVGRPAAKATADLAAFTWQLAGTGAGVLLIGLAGGWVISRRIFRPVAVISDAASRISAANLSGRIDTAALDAELVELARVLNATFDRLEAAFARQARFTADASHELRTPLTVIRSQAELALSRPRTPEEYQKAIQACLTATERMTDLVERLLALARADAGRAGLRAEPVALDRLLADAAAGLAPLAARKSVTITTELAPVVVTGDPTALSQVAVNLIGNGIEYNRPGGRVLVKLTTERGRATLAVSDTGPGIAAEHRPHVFERFYRADKARSRAAGGTGLGLAICKAVVEAHGGEIGFDTEPDRGTTFWVRLPERVAEPHEEPDG